MLRSPLKVSLLFGGTCDLHIQNFRVSQARNKHEVGSNDAALYFKNMIINCTGSWNNLKIPLTFVMRKSSGGMTHKTCRISENFLLNRHYTS
jgi:hypothetical protein